VVHYESVKSREKRRITVKRKQKHSNSRLLPKYGGSIDQVRRKNTRNSENSSCNRVFEHV